MAQRPKGAKERAVGVWEAIILGVVQGATEYLPVSSSGHLVLVPWLFGFAKAPFAFDVLVQMGTLVGVLIVYRRDLADIVVHVVKGLIARTPFATAKARLGWWVVLATVPAALIGLKFKSTFEVTFASPRAAGGFLLVTAALLTFAELMGRRRSREGAPPARSEADLTWKDAVVVGSFQAFALFPGVSRSGSTIAGGMLRGLHREGATNFSFIMSIPVMVGAGVLTLKDLVADPEALSMLALPIAVGFVVSAVTGYVVIKLFLSFVKKRGLLPFAAYCVVVGLVAIFLAPSSPERPLLPPTSAAPNPDAGE